MNPYLSHFLIGLACAVLGVCAGAPLGRQKWFSSQTLMNYAVVVLSIAALTGLFVLINNYRNATTCQTEYNQNLTVAIKERGDASDEDRRATRAMLSVILNPAASVDQRRQAVVDWDSALAKAEKKRQDNPIPLVPECAKDLANGNQAN